MEGRGKRITRVHVQKEASDFNHQIVYLTIKKLSLKGKTSPKGIVTRKKHLEPGLTKITEASLPT
jgi:hypothetical protein